MPTATHNHSRTSPFASRVYPFPAPLETVAELRARLGLAEERLTDLKAMLEDIFLGGAGVGWPLAAAQRGRRC
jgi:hypothetical protein